MDNKCNIKNNPIMRQYNEDIFEYLYISHNCFLQIKSLIFIRNYILHIGAKPTVPASL